MSILVFKFEKIILFINVHVTPCFFPIVHCCDQSPLQLFRNSVKSELASNLRAKYERTVATKSHIN